jgi:SAM-dependent methyltransferase
VITNVKIVAPVYRTLNPQSRLLDVGCGTGAFLNSIKIDKGCEVYGVDMSDAAVRSAKDSFDLDIFRGTIAQAPFPCEYFDVVTAWWYLEHVHNPNEAVAKMSAVLKEDGYCVIGVPNSDGLFAKFFKDKWYHLDCPRHLCIWSVGTITRLLARHGLSITKIMHDKTPWGLLGSLQYLFYGDNINPKWRDRLRQSRLLWMLLLPWTVLISLVRKSDIIVVYARKQSAKSPGFDRRYVHDRKQFL